MVTIMTIFLQPFRGKEGVFDVRTRPWGEGTCIEPATSTRPEAGAARHRSDAAFTFVAVFGQPKGRLLDDAFFGLMP